MPRPADERWPELHYEAWRDTRDTFHMVLQIVGKLRLTLSPPEPQWGHVPLYVTARGLNTSPIPHPNGVFDVDVDLVDHVVVVRTQHGARARVALRPRTVAEFYDELMAGLSSVGVPTRITTLPSEVPDPIPFDEDVQHASYDADAVTRFWRALVTVDEVMKEHRARFTGKVSPVQLFWGALDLSYQRYSGRFADPPTGADLIMRRTNDAEHTCTGFWPGDARFEDIAFFAYHWPHPSGYERALVVPSAAGWNPGLGEFLLRYDDVRRERDPAGALREFLETTYRSGAELASWDPALDAAGTSVG